LRQKQTADSKLVFPFYILESGDWTFSAFRIPTCEFIHLSNLKAAGRSYKPGGLLLKRSARRGRRPLLILLPRMPESPGIAGGFVKLPDLLQFGLVNFLDHHLSDAIPPVKCVRGFT
jgi:hypothetical protein